MDSMKYRNRIRTPLFSRFVRFIKSNIMTIVWSKSDVPTYIAKDVKKRINDGEREVVIPMCKGIGDKSIVDYLNEYHEKNHYWDLTFLHVAFDFVEKRIEQKLSKISGVDIEVFNISDTDKRIVIKLI